jgi:hypothetical protein
MNTSEITNQIHETTRVVVRTTPTGFRRRTMAGALLVMALTGSAVGFAAMSHADDAIQIPGTDITISAPAPAVAPPPLAPWLNGLIDRASHPHRHCGYRGFDDKYRCDWY